MSHQCGMDVDVVWMYHYVGAVGVGWIASVGTSVYSPVSRGTSSAWPGGSSTSTT